MSFNDIILKGDTLQIVDAVKAEGDKWSKFGHIVDDIKLGLCQLRSWRIEHVKRSCEYNSSYHSSRGYSVCHR
jgi:hypothetical protein